VSFSHSSQFPSCFGYQGHQLMTSTRWSRPWGTTRRTNGISHGAIILRIISPLVGPLRLPLLQMQPPVHVAGGMVRVIDREVERQKHQIAPPKRWRWFDAAEFDDSPGSITVYKPRSKTDSLNDLFSRLTYLRSHVKSRHPCSAAGYALGLTLEVGLQIIWKKIISYPVLYCLIYSYRLF